MKSRNFLLTLALKSILVLTFTLTLSVLVYGAVPYKSLYYDGATHTYTADKINLGINGILIDDDQLPIQPINIDGSRTLVPLREVFENLGAKVNFDASTNTVTVIDGENTVVVTVGSKTGYINSKAVEMDAEPKYVSLSSTEPKKVMIPLRFVGEGLGYQVNYDAKNRIVNVDAVNKNEDTAEEKEDVVVEKTVKLTDASTSTISASSEATANITGYELPTTNNKTFTLVFDKPVSSVKKSVLTDGRLVVDVGNSLLSIPAVNKTVSVGTLTNVRVAQFEDKPNPVSRVVLTFNNDSTYSVNLSTDRKKLTISFANAGEKPVVPVQETNATKLEFTTNGVTDSFLIYGQTNAPVIKAVQQVNDNKLYIDVLRPNKLLDNAFPVNSSGAIVSEYKMYNVDDTITRIEVNTKGKYVQSTVTNGNLTKIYIKPYEEVVNDGGNTVVDDVGVITVTNTTNTVVLKINKSKANISSVFDTKTVTHSDKYMEKKYVLTLPVSLKNSMTLPETFNINNDAVKSIQVTASGNNTVFTINGNKVLHAKVTEDSNNIIFTIQPARLVYDKIIVIDAGHGGIDSGTKGTLNGKTYYEKDVAYDVANKAAKLIEEDKRFKVYLSRPDDKKIELNDRALFSTELEADFFISIHANSATTTIPNGIETYYFDITKEDQAYLNSKGVYVNDYRKNVTAESKAFASVVQANLIKDTLLSDRKVKHGNYAVLRQNEIPSILVEVGFMSNQRDLTNLVEDSFRTKLATSIADSVKGYYSKF